MPINLPRRPIQKISFRYNCPCGRSYRLLARLSGDQVDVFDGDEPSRFWARCRSCGKRFPKTTPQKLIDSLVAGV